MFDWPQFLTRNRIPFVTEGKNTPRGSIGIKCPFCGVADPSEHMVIRLSGKGWRCWRDQSHSGSSPERLIQALIHCSLAAALELVSLEAGAAISAGVEDRMAMNLSTEPP